MEAGSITSVGKGITRQNVVTTSHPLYQAVTSAVDAELSDLAAKRGEAKASGRPSIVTVALEGEELSTLSQVFPEFRMLNYAGGRCAHAWWTQYRKLANEWIAMQAEKFSSSVVHVGGSAVPYLFGNMEQVSLYYDPLVPMALHDKHAAYTEAYQLFMRFSKVSRDMQRDLKREPYELFLRDKFCRYKPMTSVNMDSADALCIDGCAYGYSPTQVAAMMRQSNAQVGFGFFVYSPSMLFEQSGEIAGTGVQFTKSETGLRLSYPEGVAGTEWYPGSTWDAWLTSHVVETGLGADRVWYQLELLKNRGHLMFYRMTRLVAEPDDVVVSHALEVPDAAESYLMTSWELRKQGLDPARKSSWVEAKFFANKRLVDRTYAFAMQLDKKEFTRYAVRKQVQTVNDRVVVEGTSVNVHSPLGVKYVTRLATAVYVKAFVDRYESGMLLTEAMTGTQMLGLLDSSSTAKKVAVIACVCATVAWDYTAGAVLSYVGKLADRARDALGQRVVQILQEPVVSEVPPYVLVTDVNSWLASGSTKHMLSELSLEVDRQASLSTIGPFSSLVRAWATHSGGLVRASATAFRVCSVPLEFSSSAVTATAKEVFGMLRGLNVVDEPVESRHTLEAVTAVRVALSHDKVDFLHDADPIFTLNEFYGRVCPGVPVQNLEYDTASVSLDPQDRVLAAPYLKLPAYFGEGPKSRAYYRSRLRALNVPKRQGTTQELLSAIAARNLNAPQVSLPQDEDAMIREIWECFLSTACVEDAREKLKAFQADTVGLEEQAFMDWVTQSTPDKLIAVKADLQKMSRALEEMDVSDYIVMLKSDVKPTLSVKPLTERTEPQVIVYHDKHLSALFSSVFRVLVRRFLSLLRPNFHVNLLKDSKDIEGFVNGVHPFGVFCQFLENDFSKYDKSQGRFVFKLEEFVFRQLGMNEAMLHQWMGGHVECSMRALSLGLSLHVMYQRKSGDATTAFGNVMLNIMSVCYAYRGSNVLWALFMGDDSLVCCTNVACRDESVQVLAEVFNLGAKNYVTSAPYFASNFVLIDEINRRVALVPDPVKRVERWSMAVAAEEPLWHERWVSAKDSLSGYLSAMRTAGLANAVAERYPVDAGEVVGVADAVATLVADEAKFRQIWEEEPEVSSY